ncbi:TraR/DksA C4-type zinc finger protein [Aeromicrobium sp. IC_218]|uniref:TraR/DksA family transcriptional regulator n=1 Tax=Aeromicrobium sp. IC_218 TaxID=2545468 RepID=UPI001040AE1E|nr:TraR/DksA C4-type zinc finger protein [Aeromicrobium sp. IC_218]TCJ00027.1 TraR/DksA family transcriptional regulator [Aeromicrobium sp. IC_218]
MDDVRQRLDAELAAALGRLTALDDDHAAIVSASEGSNADDEHDPEGATIAFERAQVEALADQARRRADEARAALARLDAGTYGTCERCGEPIPPERLAARPTASLCLRCASVR